MLPSFTLIHLLYLVLAILFEIMANLLLKLSQGFKYKIPAIFAILFVFAAFTALSFSIQGLHLSVAYALWGGIGVIASALLGITVFAERLRFTGWVGLALLTVGVILVEFSN